MGIEPMSEAWKLSTRHETFESAAFLTFFVFLKLDSIWSSGGSRVQRVQVRWRQSPPRPRPCSASDNVEFPVEPRKVSACHPCRVLSEFNQPTAVPDLIAHLCPLANRISHC